MRTHVTHVAPPPVGGLGGCRWKWSPEHLALLSHPGAPAVLDMSSANGWWGCPGGCPYCYARAMVARWCAAVLRELEEADRGHVPIGNPLQLPKLLADVQRPPGPVPRWIVCASMTDPLLPGEVRQFYTLLIQHAAAWGHPVLLLTKQAVRDPRLVVPDEAAPGHVLAWGVTLSCLDDRARELEPGTAPPRRRLAMLARVAAASLELPPGQLVPWAALTLHATSGSPAVLARRAFEYGAQVLAAEVVHGRTGWCRRNAVPEEYHRDIADQLLAVAEEWQRPVACKEELRVAMLKHFPERYAAQLDAARPGTSAHIQRRGPHA